ncbi:hypothetical protein QZH41_015443, partial [Actinostola sp. cb2023]
ETPKEIARRIKNWMKLHGITQQLFAEHVLQRKQTTFSDIIRLAGDTWANNERGVIWNKIIQFLNSTEKQRAMVQHKQGQTRKRTSVNTPNTSESAKKPRKQYRDYQMASLDSLYMTTKGRPTSTLMKRTAETLEMEEKEVTVWFQNHRNREKNGSYKPGRYQLASTSTS